MIALAFIASASVGPILLFIREREQRRMHERMKADLAAMVRGEARFSGSRQFKEIA